MTAPTLKCQREVVSQRHSLMLESKKKRKEKKQLEFIRGVIKRKAAWALNAVREGISSRGRDLLRRSLSRLKAEMPYTCFPIELSSPPSSHSTGTLRLLSLRPSLITPQLIRVRQSLLVRGSSSSPILSFLSTFLCCSPSPCRYT